MIKIAILGAGDLGATIAQKLADEDWSAEVVIVDWEPGRPEGKALDLLEANPILRSATSLRGSHDLADIRQSRYVVVTDLDEGRAGWASTGPRNLRQQQHRDLSQEFARGTLGESSTAPCNLRQDQHSGSVYALTRRDLVERSPRTQSETSYEKKREPSPPCTELLGPSEARRLFSAIEEHAPEAVIILAANEAASLLALARASERILPRQLLGISPVALASVWRLYIGKALACSPLDVSVALVGAPPHEGLYEVFASVAGQPVENFLSLRASREVARQVSGRLPGPRTLAAAAVQILRSMVLQDRRVQSCYAWAEEAYGARGLFLCLPAVLGGGGLIRVLELRLDPARRVTVDRSVDHLTRVQQLPPHL